MHTRKSYDDVRGNMMGEGLREGRAQSLDCNEKQPVLTFQLSNPNRKKAPDFFAAGARPNVRVNSDSVCLGSNPRSAAMSPLTHKALRGSFFLAGLHRDKFVTSLGESSP
jgi:hypothetical protein